MNQRAKTDSAKTDRFVPLLLDWFADNARDLPWRRTTDPYGIWVSEIMLQQTQVKTVVPYWNRWMHQLPTIQSLARAAEGRIHKLWEGLGYYTRVRNLQKAARAILEQHEGKFPRQFDDVLALPGIGRYTAGAICSIAFNQPTPILDGNVIRVLTRVFGISENPKDKATNVRLWTLAEQLVKGSKGSCSDLNQSLMELGALICTPRAPKCDCCPIARQCVAFKEGRVEELPNVGPRAAATARRFAAFVVEKNGRWLVRKRPADVVNAHLWEFPNVELTGAELQSAARGLGVVPAIEPFHVVRHSITRYRITLEAYRCELAGRNVKTSNESEWMTAAELEPLPFTSAHKKILAWLRLQDLI